MKKRIISLFVVVLMVSSIFSVGVFAQGNEKLIQKNYDLSEFDRIKVDDAFEVEIIQGDIQSVVVEVEKKNEDKIDVTVVDGELNVGIKDHVNIIGNYSAKIVVPKLDRIEGKSASTINGNLEGEDLEIVLKAASEIELDGKVDYLNIQVESASKAELKEFIVKEAKVRATSASAISVTVTDVISGEIKSTSKINIYGNPTMNVTTDDITSEINSVNGADVSEEEITDEIEFDYENITENFEGDFFNNDEFEKIENDRLATFNRIRILQEGLMKKFELEMEKIRQAEERLREEFDTKMMEIFEMSFDL